MQCVQFRVAPATKMHRPSVINRLISQRQKFNEEKLNIVQPVILYAKYHLSEMQDRPPCTEYRDRSQDCNRNEHERVPCFRVDHPYRLTAPI